MMMLRCGWLPSYCFLLPAPYFLLLASGCSRNLRFTHAHLPAFPFCIQARISESRAVGGSSLYILNGPNPVIQRIAEELGWTAWAAAALQELLAYNSEIR